MSSPSRLKYTFDRTRRLEIRTAHPISGFVERTLFLTVGLLLSDRLAGSCDSKTDVSYNDGNSALTHRSCVWVMGTFSPSRTSFMLVYVIKCCFLFKIPLKELLSN